MKKRRKIYTRTHRHTHTRAHIQARAVARHIRGMVSLRLIAFALSSTDSLINLVCIFLLAETRSRPPFRVYFSDFTQKTLCRSNLPFPTARKTARCGVNFYGTLFYAMHFRAISAGLCITDRNIIRGTISELPATCPLR